MTNGQPCIPINQRIELPADGASPKGVHVFDERSVWAIETALQARRPLLVRGEPGTGKSQLARAAALSLGRAFISEVVHARSESQDLLYRYDAVRRLGEAQALGGAGLSPAEISDRLNPVHYLAPGPLWWALDPDSAQAQQKEARLSGEPPRLECGADTSQGCVLLIDEIDKADADLPNGLLEVLGNGGFRVPWTAEPVHAHPNRPPPLVIISTNEEKELPAAFVRRCMVLNLKLPRDEATFVEHMVLRGEQHFGDECHSDVRTRAAKMLWVDRQKADSLGHPVPGQAEYLDLLRVLVGLAPKNNTRQEELLGKVAAFALKKHPDLDGDADLDMSARDDT